MIAVSLVLLAFGVFDLVRWSPEPTTGWRSLTALVAAAAATTGVAAATGSEPPRVALIAVLAVAVLGLWLAFDHAALARRGPGWALAVPTIVLATAFAVSGSLPSGSGPLNDWYRGLPFTFADRVPLDQFLVAASGGVFLLATGNRVVRFVLEAAGTPIASGEKALRGGRLLGPMERIFVTAMVLAGAPTGAAIVIAAKGLLRLPEIRDEGAQREGRDDHVTEYFLIGTFVSLLLASGMAALISVCG